jgi:hypothetical protein
MKALNRKVRKDHAKFAKKICPKTTNPLCPGNGKRGSGMAAKFSHPESHVPRFRAESWHLAVAIYDPDPVAVAS